MFPQLKKILIPIFCMFHMTALVWWTLTHSFAGLVSANIDQTAIESKLFNWLTWSDNNALSRLFSTYIDITGNQQYWDFFAPQSPKFHQYLSVCNSLNTDTQSEAISCKGSVLFSNLKTNFTAFTFIGDSSRYYRLTETLINQNDPALFKAFTHYYSTHPANHSLDKPLAYLVAHQFELLPDLKDLTKAGYRTDKILWDCQ